MTDPVAAEYRRAIIDAKANMDHYDFSSEEYHYWQTMHDQLVTDYNRLYRED